MLKKGFLRALLFLFKEIFLLGLWLAAPIYLGAAFLKIKISSHG